MNHRNVPAAMQFEVLESRALFSAVVDAPEGATVDHRSPAGLSYPVRTTGQPEVNQGDPASEPLHGELPASWEPRAESHFDAKTESTLPQMHPELGQGRHGIAIATSGAFDTSIEVVFAPPLLQAFFGGQFNGGAIWPSFKLSYHPRPGAAVPLPDEVRSTLRDMVDPAANNSPNPTPDNAARSQVSPVSRRDGEMVSSTDPTPTSGEEIVNSTSAVAPSSHTVLVAPTEPGFSSPGHSGFFHAEPTSSERIVAQFASVFASTPIFDAPDEAGAAVSVVTRVSGASAIVAIPAARAVAVAAPMMFYFPRLGSASAFMLDSIAALTDEFALPEIEAEKVLPARALTVTAAVIAADLLLLGTLFRKRSMNAKLLHVISAPRRYNGRNV